MCFFPTYAEKFEHLYQFVLDGLGPLPMFWRNYIAILVSAGSRARALGRR
jgi:hypothetical protein